MKKILAMAVVLMMVPFSAYALEMLTEEVMDEVTGQAGVSIAVDDVKIFQHITSLEYTDSDGAFIGDAAGSVGIANLKMMVNINAITSLDGSGLPVSPGQSAVFGDYTDPSYATFDFSNADTDGDGLYDAFEARPIKIDVGNCAALTAGLTNNNATLYGGLLPSVNVAGVVIGLPTVEIHQSALEFDVVLTQAGSANADGGGTFGTISIGEQTVSLLGGTLEIAPH
jgi:hypothetical protein